jgi:hypothetical protein
LDDALWRQNKWIERFSGCEQYGALRDWRGDEATLENERENHGELETSVAVRN